MRWQCVSDQRWVRELHTPRRKVASLPTALKVTEPPCLTPVLHQDERIRMQTLHVEGSVKSKNATATSGGRQSPEGGTAEAGTTEEHPPKPGGLKNEVKTERTRFNIPTDPL